MAPLFIRDTNGTYRRADKIVKAKRHTSPRGPEIYMCDTDDGDGFSVVATMLDRIIGCAYVIPAHPGYSVWMYDLTDDAPSIFRAGTVIAWALDASMMWPAPITEEDGATSGDNYLVETPRGEFFRTDGVSLPDRAAADRWLAEETASHKAAAANRNAVIGAA